MSLQETSSPLWHDVIHGLTIGETYFFRNTAYMNALQQHVIPGLLRRNQRSLRVWSVGCATGEEPYTLAMLLRDQITDIANFDLCLLGTDINEGYLASAKRGVYRAHSFRSETPDHVQKRWFTPNTGSFQIKQELRDMVTFRQLNLAEATYPSELHNLHDFDLIMCRNVTIYFQTETTRRIVRQLWQSLADGGWLILGHSEAMLYTSPEVKTHNFANAIFYQRQKGAPPARQATAAPVSEQSRRRRLTDSNRLPAPRPVTERLPKRPPETAETLYKMAKQSADHADWQKALQYLDRAEIQNNLDPKVYYLRALVYRENQQHDEAFAALRKALYCNPNFIMAHYTLGEMQEAAGATQEAKREWTLAQNALAGYAATDFVAGEEELSVEMLRGLIDFKMKAIGG